MDIYEGKVYVSNGPIIRVYNLTTLSYIETINQTITTDTNSNKGFAVIEDHIYVASHISSTPTLAAPRFSLVQELNQKIYLSLLIQVILLEV